MSRIRTCLLDQAFYNALLRYSLGDHVELFAPTASTGGTAIDEHGNMYISDTDRMIISRISPNGTVTIIVQDHHLEWIDSKGTLWMPSAQLNRGIPFNDGTSKIKTPTHVYTMALGVGPSKIDHK